LFFVLWIVVSLTTVLQKDDRTIEGRERTLLLKALFFSRRDRQRSDFYRVVMMMI